MNGGGHPAGNVLIGDHEAQRCGGAENAQQEHRSQFAPAEAKIASRRQAVGHQAERRHTPAVGQHFERRISHPDQQQGEQRSQSESRRREGRPENSFDAIHTISVYGDKSKQYIRIPHRRKPKSNLRAVFPHGRPTPPAHPDGNVWQSGFLCYFCTIKYASA